MITTAAQTFFALIAFAANSIFARLALGSVAIDAASYTTVRLLSGTLTLWLIARHRQGDASAAFHKQWLAAAMLFLYAVTFSFAYISLPAGTGALILFAAVQITMVSVGLYVGERPSLVHWLGLIIAIAGLIYLVFPGVAAPSALGSLLMVAAGLSWGVYSILGRNVTNPVQATAENFLRAVPLTLIVSAIGWSSFTLTLEGMIWAGLSGALSSALGYVIWYAALPRLTATLAATVQLLVPALAALGGVIFLAERMTLRLILSGIIIFVGVGLAICAQKK